MIFLHLVNDFLQIPLWYLPVMPCSRKIQEEITSLPCKKTASGV